MSHANRYRSLGFWGREHAGIGELLARAARDEAPPGDHWIRGIVAADQVAAGAVEQICRVRVTESGAVEFEDLEPVPLD